MTDEEFIARLKKRFPNQPLTFERTNEKLIVKVRDEIISLSWEKDLDEKLNRLYGINAEEEILEVFCLELEAILEGSTSTNNTSGTQSP
jgi:hypothetical protein